MRPHLVLYQYFRSSTSYRVRLGLAYKGLQYATRCVSLLDGAQHAAEHLARSPMGTVPCLVVEGRALTESVAILEYLDDLEPTRPLLPRDPWARAKARELVQIVNSGIQPLHNLAALRRHSDDAAEQRAFAQHFLNRGLRALEAKLGPQTGEGGAFALGAEPSMVDALIAPQLYQARRFGADLALAPRALAIADAVAATAWGMAAAPESQPDYVV